MPFYSRFCIGERSERGCTPAPHLLFRRARFFGNTQKNSALVSRVRARQFPTPRFTQVTGV